VALSRPRAVDLAARILERFQKSPSIELTKDANWVRGRILQALVDWDRQNDRIHEEVRARLLARAGRVQEGSREWDLLFGEELQRAYDEIAARGE
jgi:hypothetical protein